MTVAPKVISASRATDIPAFHADWLIERLRRGYCEWTNPFNASQTQLVSFQECKAIVFWSKNPAPLLSRLPEISALGMKYYFQFTLNDYGREGLEPGVPPLGKRIGTFIKLAGICPVIWRYDPVLMGCGLTVKEHLRRIKELLAVLAMHTSKLVFSFADVKAYKKVETRLRKFNRGFREPDAQEMNDFATGLAELNSALEKPLQLGICGEEMDFSRLGIAKNRCLDPELLERLVSVPDAQCSLLPLQVNRKTQFNHSKDRSQRKLCGCAPGKDIGSYRMQCGHRCVYCYAGHQ